MKVEMIKFGTTLTDRSDGKKAAEQILQRVALPVALDFAGVMALGSSFGDEVVLKLAPLQNNLIRVLNANNSILNSLKRVVEDREICLEFG